LLPLFPPLYVILDPEYTSAPIVAIADRLARAGVKIIQLRDKRAPAGKILA
jgi:thiamine monophosphate synthase